MQRIPMEAGQDWQEYLDLASAGWKYEMAPQGRPFFPQGRLEGIVAGSIPAQGLDVVLAEFQCNAGEFACVQYAGVEAFFRVPDQALGVPSTPIPAGDLGLGAWWSLQFQGANNAETRAVAALRDLEGLITGPLRGGFFRMEFLGINDGWNPVIFDQGEGTVKLILSLRDLGVYADGAILFFNGQFSGYSAPVPQPLQHNPYPYGKPQGSSAPMWHPTGRNG